MNAWSLKWEQCSVLLASGGRDLQLSTTAILSSNDRRKSLPVPLPAGHNSASHQIFTREQMAFNSILVPSGTLLDLAGHIRARNTQSEQGPAWSLPSWQSSAHTNCCMLPFRTRNNPNKKCGSMPKQVLQLSSTINGA